MSEVDLWEHSEAAKKLNALYANRIYVQPLPEGAVRINFGETMDADPSYHTAIVATPHQALDFASVIFRIAQAMIEDQKSADAALAAMAAAEDARRAANEAVKAAVDSANLRWGSQDGNIGP